MTFPDKLNQNDEEVRLSGTFSGMKDVTRRLFIITRCIMSIDTYLQQQQ